MPDSKRGIGLVSDPWLVVGFASAASGNLSSYIALICECFGGFNDNEGLHFSRARKPLSANRKLRGWQRRGCQDRCQEGP